jgi:hypothetical protein
VRSVEPLRDPGDPKAIVDPGSESETVFTVLAAQARSRTRAGLWTTTIGGALNAGLIAWQYPSLLWLAAGCLAVAAYGGWGLVDRAIQARVERSINVDVPENALPELRWLIAVVGTGSALVAAVTFMRWALGAWFR